MDNVYDLKAYREMMPWKRRRVVRRWFLKKEVEKRERQEAIKRICEKRTNLIFKE